LAGVQLSTGGVETRSPGIGAKSAPGAVTAIVLEALLPAWSIALTV